MKTHGATLGWKVGSGIILFGSRRSTKVVLESSMTKFKGEVLENKYRIRRGVKKIFLLKKGCQMVLDPL